MTIKELTTTILSIAKSQSNVNYVGEGDIYVLNSTPDINYGVFFITQNNHTLLSQFDTINYNLNLFYVDRLTEDGKNKLDIQSIGMLVITNVINILANNYDIDITSDIQFTTFTQRFTDECAGVYCTITINADNPIGRCGV